MNWFQLITLPVLGLLLLWEGVGLWRRSAGRGAAVARCLTWGATMVAIAVPDLMQVVASAVGIGRGTDFVLYGFVFVVLGTSFYFYSRYVQLQRQLAEVVRHIALERARRGSECDADPGRTVGT